MEQRPGDGSRHETGHQSVSADYRIGTELAAQGAATPAERPNSCARNVLPLPCLSGEHLENLAARSKARLSRALACQQLPTYVREEVSMRPGRMRE